jgi:hypothetical protein
MTADHASSLVRELYEYDFEPVEETYLRGYVHETQVYVKNGEYFNTEDLSDLINVAERHGLEIHLVGVAFGEARAYFTQEESDTP